MTSIEPCHESVLHLNGFVRGKRLPNLPNLFGLDLTAEKPSVNFARKHLRVEGLPDQIYLCNFGIDLLTPLLFDILKYNCKHGTRTKGEIQLRDAMEELMRQEELYGCLMQGDRYDIGIPQNLLKTLMAFGLHGPYREKVRQVIAER